MQEQVASDASNCQDLHACRSSLCRMAGLGIPAQVQRIQIQPPPMLSWMAAAILILWQ